jgi:hypothetical protein
MYTLGVDRLTAANFGDLDRRHGAREGGMVVVGEKEGEMIDEGIICRPT